MAVLGLLRARYVWLALLTCLAPRMAPAQPPGDAAEASVKAVFLYNFSKYVTWPATTIGERSPADIRICVPANDTFYALLTRAVEGETVDGKPLVPMALDGLDAARDCQILYVGNSQSLDGRAWLSAVRGRQVLTVGDGALSDDTVIAFVRDGGRVRFDINRQSATARHLNVSAKLLRLARQVRER